MIPRDYLGEVTYWHDRQRNDPIGFCCEPSEKADIGIVFGAANKVDLIRLTRCGVELYHSGLISKLLVTGGGALAASAPEAR